MSKIWNKIKQKKKCCYWLSYLSMGEAAAGLLLLTMPGLWSLCWKRQHLPDGIHAWHCFTLWVICEHLTFNGSINCSFISVLCQWYLELKVFRERWARTWYMACQLTIYILQSKCRLMCFSAMCSLGLLSHCMPKFALSVMAVLLLFRPDQQPRKTTTNFWPGWEQCYSHEKCLSCSCPPENKRWQSERAWWCCQVYSGELTLLKLWFDLCPGAMMWIRMRELSHFISDIWNSQRLWVLPQSIEKVRYKNIACRHVPQELFWTPDGQGEPSWLAMLCVYGPIWQMPSLTPMGRG